MEPGARPAIQHFDGFERVSGDTLIYGFKMNDNAMVDGYIEDVDNKPVAILDNIEVTGEYANQGIGEQLVREFTEESVQRGALALESCITNPVLLRIFQRVFGEDNMRFSVNIDGEQWELPITTEQAIKILEAENLRADFDYEYAFEGYTGIRTRADLTIINSSQLS